LKIEYKALKNHLFGVNYLSDILSPFCKQEAFKTVYVPGILRFIKTRVANSHDLALTKARNLSTNKDVDKHFYHTDRKSCKFKGQSTLVAVLRFSIKKIALFVFLLLGFFVRCSRF